LGKTLIHERSAVIKIYEIEKDKILMEGILTDERFCRMFLHASQKAIDPSMLHRIVVKIILSLPKFIIESAEAEMITVPDDVCREVENVVKKIVGLQITSGFKGKVRELMGGAKGCLHISNLLLFMSTAALQGSHTYYNRLQEDGTLKRPAFDRGILADSCHFWKKEGR